MYDQVAVPGGEACAERSEVKPPGDARGVAVAGDYNYIADFDGGLVRLRLANRLYVPLVTRGY